MHPSLRAVAGRFPQVLESIERIFERDEAFRDLCEEYQECSVTILRLEAKEGSSHSIRKEYAVLLLRLEGELLRYLEEHPAS
jgi:hypothetical protein